MGEYSAVADTLEIADDAIRFQGKAGALLRGGCSGPPRPGRRLRAGDKLRVTAFRGQREHPQSAHSLPADGPPSLAWELGPSPWDGPLVSAWRASSHQGISVSTTKSPGVILFLCGPVKCCCLPVGEDVDGLVLRPLHLLFFWEDCSLSFAGKLLLGAENQRDDSSSVQPALGAPTWVHGSSLCFLGPSSLSLPWPPSLCTEITRLFDLELPDWNLFDFKFPAPARVWHMLGAQ